MSLLVRQHHEQKLQTIVDVGSSEGRKFQGLEDITRAVEVSFNHYKVDLLLCIFYKHIFIQI